MTAALDTIDSTILLSRISIIGITGTAYNGLNISLLMTKPCGTPTFSGKDLEEEELMLTKYALVVMTHYSNYIFYIFTTLSKLLQSYTLQHIIAMQML